MKYNFKEIESKWQKYWVENKTFYVNSSSEKPKFYVLDMFPYPSGAGLHVGHPLGYIASDIISRYKRTKGFNVLHPIGFDSFGLPAEQYAIQTGQAPQDTSKANIKKYRSQLKKIGLSFQWDREVITSDPSYYKWTQWIFLKLFNSWYNKDKSKAENISSLIKIFENDGNLNLNAAQSKNVAKFNSSQWKEFTEEQKQKVLLKYRLAYIDEGNVNWCPKLGTVLANDEVKDGFSERGGFPVVQKKMKQWYLRISAYCERLIKGLEKIECSNSLKEIQKNWIGKSQGVYIDFKIKDYDKYIKVFSTRPDTIFGSTFIVLAPEIKFIRSIITKDKKEGLDKYINKVKLISQKDRMANFKNISGFFTGLYCIHPFTKKNIPIWISEYVLQEYGTGCIMAVPAHDQRDFKFAKKFNLNIKQVIKSDIMPYENKVGKLINSQFLNGLSIDEAINDTIKRLENSKLGTHVTLYKLRDAVFSRQRYWGEPFPIFFKKELPFPLKENQLPLILPKVDKYLPTSSGEPPLKRAKDWKTKDEQNLETQTMPGWAGSSWYFLRYMSANNTKEFLNKKDEQYWKNVDIYVGGAEHATGHLIYSRFWNKFLKDIGYVSQEEPFKKIINQGMILAKSYKVHLLIDENKFVSNGIKTKYKKFISIYVDSSLVKDNVLDIDKFKKSRKEFDKATFELENGKYICYSETEKMSKSKFNVIMPDDVIDKYGADALRMYEMFLGPINKSKPWSIKGINGVFNFLNKLWGLFFINQNIAITDDKPTNEELKIIHSTIKKVSEDIENFSFNTAISSLMICVNKLKELKTTKKSILEPLVIILSPLAPHISEELWRVLGHKQSISYATFPKYNAEYIKENMSLYPISFNGKTRLKIEFPSDMSEEDIKKELIKNDKVKSILKEKPIKKIIVIKNKIVNFVF